MILYFWINWYSLLYELMRNLNRLHFFLATNIFTWFTIFVDKVTRIQCWLRAFCCCNIFADTYKSYTVKVSNEIIFHWYHISLKFAKNWNYLCFSNIPSFRVSLLLLKFNKSKRGSSITILKSYFVLNLKEEV